MTRINIYDTDAETIETVCRDNDISEAYLIELLLDYLDDVKRDNGFE